MRELGSYVINAHKAGLKLIFTSFGLSLLFALCVAFIPHYELSQKAVYTLFILLFSASLWITEAIPAFAVSLLIIALEILLLGFDNFNFSSGSKEWELYLQPWASPLIFLFLAGFIMAEAASKTKLDIWLAKKVLYFVGDKPHNIISGIIAISYTFSMFISNTATAAMMMTIIIPLLAKVDAKFQKALLLSVMIGTNLGGMATIIGTPPNAIAVGMLADKAPTFLGWIVLAFVPSLVVVLILRILILKLYPSTLDSINLQTLNKIDDCDDSAKTCDLEYPSWKKTVTIILFALTILLWLTGPLHHIPTTVVSLIPIIGFTLFGILDGDDMTKIRWDVIILIIGGLNLGLAVSQTGLDLYIASLISTDTLSIMWLMFIFSYLAVVISNFMSNTAATNIILPIVIALAMTISKDSTQMVAVAVALSTSFAMCLAVSTPPNAILYASKRLESKDFLITGIIAAIIGPLVVIAWLKFLAIL